MTASKYEFMDKSQLKAECVRLAARAAEAEAELQLIRMRGTSLGLPELAGRLASTVAMNSLMKDSVEKLAAIADAYDRNELDDEARKFWGANHEHQNQRLPETIELYTGRGGKCLLTLADCMQAREALRGKVSGG